MPHGGGCHGCAQHASRRTLASFRARCLWRTHASASSRWAKLSSRSCRHLSCSACFSRTAWVRDECQAAQHVPALPGDSCRLGSNHRAGPVRRCADSAPPWSTTNLFHAESLVPGLLYGLVCGDGTMRLVAGRARFRRLAAGAATPGSPAHSPVSQCGGRRGVLTRLLQLRAEVLERCLHGGVEPGIRVILARDV